MRSAILAFLIFIPVLAPVDHEAAKESYRQGNEYFDQSRYPDAASAYARALEQDPQFLEAAFNKALADEMVDRQKSLADWGHFAQAAGNSPDFKYQVGQANARIQILKALPVYPDALQPSHYVSSAGDYYGEIAEDSESSRWQSFPVKVWIGDVPNGNWHQGVREAFDIWHDMVPMELTADSDEADIRFEWDAEQNMDEGHAGEERDWVQFESAGNSVTSRKVAHIAIALVRNWTKDEMRALTLHEMGHALGIRGHSPSKGDIMYWHLQESNRRMPIPRMYYPLILKSLVSKPSQRDLNTLIRLYNTPGVVTRMN